MNLKILAQAAPLTVCCFSLELLCYGWVKVHNTLFTGLSQGFLDGEVEGSLLVSHEEFAEDGVLVVCRGSQSGSRAGRRRSP